MINVGKYNKLSILSTLMESQIDHKRNIFRASLRREYIESYQRSIRLKYLQMAKQQKRKQQLKQNIQNTILNLEIILKMNSQQICTVDNFDYFIQSIDIVASKKSNQVSTAQSLVFPPQQRNQYYCEPRMSNYGTDLNRNSNNFNANNNSKFKITSIWVHKQKIFSLLYRILDKVLGQSTGRLKYVLDRVLYMLEFPELMPLWQSLSCVSDQNIKNYCSKQFVKKLSKPTAIYSDFVTIQNRDMEYFNSILDPDFVLDILTNFIVQSPCVSFQNSLQLVPFINYALNINQMGVQQMKQQLYPKLNKVCTILRSILKQDSKERLAKMVQQGFGDIFIFLMRETCKLFGTKQKNRYRRDEEFGRMDQQYQNLISQSPVKDRLQCGYMSSGIKGQIKMAIKAPINLLMATKINLARLISRIFVANSNVSIFLYFQQSGINLFHAFTTQFIHKQNGCDQSHQNSYENVWLSESQSIERAQYIRLCDGHRILLNTILSAISAMLIAASSSENQFVEDFLSNEGFLFLQKCLLFQNVCVQQAKQTANIILTLDSSNGQLYNRLDSREFTLFAKIQLNLIKVWSNQYFLSSQLTKPTLGSTTNLALMFEIRNSLTKILKINRNTLLMAYARATQPCIFEEIVDLIAYSQQYRQLFDQLVHLQLTNQTSQIKLLSAHILQICNNPKNYIASHNERFDQRNL